MKKFRLYWHKDKNENFINNMASKGWMYKKFFFGVYTFEKGQPNEYTYRCDLISDKNTTELNEYIQLIEDTGAEYVQRWGIWGVFRKKGEFELYTDKESKRDQYRKIRKFFLGMFIFEVACSLRIYTEYFKYKNNVTLVMIIIISLIIGIFLKEVIRCNRKIKELED